MISYPYFTFNGKSCKDFLVCAMEIDLSILNPMDIPYNISLSREDRGNRFAPMYTETEEAPEEIVINLFFDTDSGLLEWSDERIQQITNWLITDDFEAFQLEDSEYIYYFKCTNIQKQLNYKKRGYLEVTFQPLCMYAFKRVIIDEFIQGKQLVNITNPSRWIHYPLLQVESLDGCPVYIDKLIISDILVDEVFNIDCDMLTCINQENENKITNINRQWLEIKSGDNQIAVEGNCHIRIICEFPMIA